MQHTSTTSSSSLHCNDSEKVNITCIILSSTIHVFFHHYLLPINVWYPVYVNYISYEIYEAAIPYDWQFEMYFLALVSCYKIDMIIIWETEVCWLQGLDKHTPENRTKDLRR